VIYDPRVDFLLAKLDQQRKTLSTLAGGIAEQHARVATDLNVVVDIACGGMVLQHFVLRESLDSV
jgi:hypothetical protein